MKLKRIYIEITNACNLDCPFCTNNKGYNFINIKDIENIFKQAKEYTDNIYLHVLGEPLMHPNIEEIFDIASNIKLNINLVTNGTLLYKYPNILNKKSLRKLSISVHSVNNINIDKNYYEQIIDIINENNEKYIELRFYDKNNLSNNNKHFLSTLQNIYEFKKTDREDSYKLKNNTYIKYSNIFKWPSINDEIISDKGYCHGALDQIAILSNKDVTICCLDPKGYNKIGNLNEQTLKEILESNKYLDIRNGFKNHKVIEELCKKCTYRQKFN